MESIRRIRTLNSRIYLVISALILGIGISACRRTPEVPPPKSPPKTETPSRSESPTNTPAADVPAGQEKQEKSATDQSAAGRESLEKTAEHPSPEDQAMATRLERSKRVLEELEKKHPGVMKDLEEPIPPTEELGKTPPEGMQNPEKNKLPDEEEIRRYQEEAEKNRQEEEKKYWASLGEPLVDHPENLFRNRPDSALWIDPKDKQVVMIGTVCQTEAPLEMFACQRGTKEHEAILSVPTLAQDVHFDLLLVGAKAGHPVQFGPAEGQYTPAAGTKIDITVRWKDAQGKMQTARAQDWIKNMKTGKPLKADWVFGGSGFYKDETTGKEFYKAEGGDFICVSNFPSAMLDLPIQSSDVNAELLFQANPARVPPQGTPVTIILSPKRETEK